MRTHIDGSVTLTAEEVRWLNDNFQGGRHCSVSTMVVDGPYKILDNEGDECGWGRGNGEVSARHVAFMDAFTALTD